MESILPYLRRSACIGVFVCLCCVGVCVCVRACALGPGLFVSASPPEEG